MVDQDEMEEWVRDSISWPQYFVAGEGVDEENFVPAYYKVEGPNGPASYRNPTTDPCPVTMYGLVVEARCDSFRRCRKEETPWADE